MKPRPLLPILVFAVAALSTLGWAQERGASYGPHMMWGGWHGMYFGPVMMIIFIAVAIVLVVLAVRWLGGTGHAPTVPPYTPPGKAPLDILKDLTRN